MDAGSIGSMKERGVTESYKLKRQVVLSATEAAEMIIRYDDRLLVASQVFNFDVLLAEWTIFYVRHRGKGRQYKEYCSLNRTTLAGCNVTKVTHSCATPRTPLPMLRIVSSAYLHNPALPLTINIHHTKASSLLPQ